MTENNRLAAIKQRLDTNAYFVNPLSDAHVADDMRYLLELIEEQRKKMDALHKKNEVLAQHALELTQEMENVKSDFGNDR
jgi:hypothetical protein